MTCTIKGAARKWNKKSEKFKAHHKFSAFVKKYFKSKRC